MTLRDVLEFPSVKTFQDCGAPEKKNYRFSNKENNLYQPCKFVFLAGIGALLVEILVSLML